MQNVAFYKYHGTGNDFVLVDNREEAVASDDYHRFARWCHRRFGIGADGVILLDTTPSGLPLMRYYNADGRPGSFCGNGSRCFVRFAQQLGLVADTEFEFAASDGLHTARLEGDMVEIRMNTPTAIVHQLGEEPRDAGYILDTGSPHYVRVLPLNGSAEWFFGLDLAHELPGTHHVAGHLDDGINVNLLMPTSHPHTVLLRTWERGVEAETFSCGTGAVAAALVQLHVLRQATGTVHIQTLGGELAVRVDAPPGTPWLCGPAVRVFSGTLND